MKYMFTFFCTLISTLLIHSIPECRKNNVDKGNVIVDDSNRKTKNKYLDKNGKEQHEEHEEHEGKEDDEKYEGSEVYEDHENHKECANSHNIVKKNINHHNNNNINNNDVEIISIKDSNSLTKEIIDEIRNVEKFNKDKKSVEELKLLEEKSKSLLVDINEWIESVRNIEDKSNDLKNIKNQILININSLNETLTAEIENIKYIKILEKKQNELFSENWIYALSSTSDNLKNANEFSNHHPLNLLESSNKKNNEKNVIGVKKNDNTKSHSLHIFLNYFIFFLITVIFN